jgi:membrane protease YdiL (CAAX protease family)
MTTPVPLARRVASAAWRIALVVLVLGASVAATVALLQGTDDPSDPTTLLRRVGAGIAISALTLGVIMLVTRRIDRKAASDAGLTSMRTGWPLAAWGAVVWLVPAAAAFGVLSLLGSPLTVSVPVTELVPSVLLLVLAVWLTEAIPEEAVFRGYVTTTLGTMVHGWWIITIQAALFALFAGLLRQSWNPVDLSLFVTMGIAFGYLRMLTDSVWMPIGFHTAFQTGAQLVLTHDTVDFAGDTGAAMLALGVIPFTTAAILVSTTGIPRLEAPAEQTSR